MESKDSPAENHFPPAPAVKKCNSDNRESQTATRSSAMQKENTDKEEIDDNNMESKGSQAEYPPPPVVAMKNLDNDSSFTEPKNRSPPTPALVPSAMPVTPVAGWSWESEKESCPTLKHPQKCKKEATTLYSMKPPQKSKLTQEDTEAISKCESNAPTLCSNKQRKKRKFTEREMEAIHAGVRRFGKGEWNTICITSGGHLMSRTNVNIKDCYRNMEKRGEGVD
jgi:hypothetical protein